MLHKVPITVKDITEVSGEVEIYPRKPSYRKITLIVNFVNGKPFIKYGVYHGKICIRTLHSLETAVEDYNDLDGKQPPSDVKEEHLVEEN